MKNRKELLPAQRRFLQYLIAYKTHTPSGRRSINSRTKDRIDTALKNGEYIIGGNYQRNFNRLRNDYMEEFKIYEE